ncbi:MAG: DUF2384 domain-containing protein [bacterium]|nr:DUF2384 domain-containing protein [bacterium]
MELTGVTEVLGGINVLHQKLNSRMDLIELSNRGVSKGALLRLAKYLDLSVKQMTEVLTVTERTVQRYSMESNFNRAVSEQILHIAEAAARGTHVFGDKNKFLSWMKQPNQALANKTPMELLGSRFGAEMVLDELGRIKHGVFS